MKSKKKTALLFCTLAATSHFCKASDKQLTDHADAVAKEELLNGQGLYYMPGAESRLRDLHAKRSRKATPAPSALATLSESDACVLAKFNKGDDDQTEEAANLALLLIANSPLKKAEREVARHTQTCQDGKKLMMIGGTVFTFFQSLNLLAIPPTSCYSDLRNSSILVGSAFGYVCAAAGIIQHSYGKFRLNKEKSQ